MFKFKPYDPMDPRWHGPEHVEGQAATAQGRAGWLGRAAGAALALWCRLPATPRRWLAGIGLYGLALVLWVIELYPLIQLVIGYVQTL